MLSVLREYKRLGPLPFKILMSHFPAFVWFPDDVVSLNGSLLLLTKVILGSSEDQTSAASFSPSFVDQLIPI